MGVIESCSQSPFAGAFEVFGEEAMQKLAISTSAGAVAGGVTAELFGGSFGEGAAMGASSAAGYVVKSAIGEHLNEEKVAKATYVDPEALADALLLLREPTPEEIAFLTDSFKKS